MHTTIITCATSGQDQTTR